MTEKQEPPKDAFGTPQVWVESYGGFLPNSENIPTAAVRNGVSGVTHDGGIYCVDCALDMGLIERSDLSNGRLLDKPWTGLVLPSHECQTQSHCGNHKHCINAIDGENHPYTHDEKIGIGIEERVIEH